MRERLPASFIFLALVWIAYTCIVVYETVGASKFSSACEEAGGVAIAEPQLCLMIQKDRVVKVL